MRKGDIRKAAIIDTAEELFYTKGYENTSVQDVLDALKLSKGGFYHHFESKLSLLDAICEKRVGAYTDICAKCIDSDNLTGIEKLNCVFAYCTYLKDESQKYVSIMLDVAYKQQAVMLREHMNIQMRELLRDFVKDAVEEGISQNIFFAKYTDELSGILLRLAGELTDEISFTALKYDSAADRKIKILSQINAYSYACETLLNAPHGSIIMMDEGVVNTLETALDEIAKNEVLPEE